MVQTQHYQKQLVYSQSSFSPEEIRNFSNLGDILRQIRSRLLSEGISIDDARTELLKKYEKQKPK